MNYWRIFFAFSLILLVGVFLVADNLNEQLSCQAAQIFQLQVEEENLQLSILNVSCSFTLPTMFSQSSGILAEKVMKQTILPLVEQAKPKLKAFVMHLYEGTGELMQKAKSWRQYICNEADDK